MIEGYYCRGTVHPFSPSWLIAVLLGATLAMAVADGCDRSGDVAHAQIPPAEGAMGTWQGARYTLAEGLVDAAEHESEDGYFSVGGPFSMSAPPKSIPADLLRQQRGKRVRIIMEIIGDRELKTVGR